jgi:hypothetical protein
MKIFERINHADLLIIWTGLVDSIARRNSHYD